MAKRLLGYIKSWGEVGEWSTSNVVASCVLDMCNSSTTIKASMPSSYLHHQLPLQKLPHILPLPISCYLLPFHFVQYSHS